MSKKRKSYSADLKKKPVTVTGFPNLRSDAVLMLHNQGDSNEQPRSN